MAAKDEKKAEPAEPKVEKKSSGTPGVDEDTVLLSEVDPADRPKDVKFDPATMRGGTSVDDTPEAPVSKAFAATIEAQRKWEAEQGKLAEIPDPEAEAAKAAAKT